MMKKLFLISFILLFTVGIVCSAVIDIDQPKGNSVWMAGTQKEIVWTNPPGVTTNIKIRLLDSTGNKFLEITNNEVNTGKFQWNIPGTLAINNYSIRVKTVDNKHSGDSPLFKIINGAVTTKYRKKSLKNINVEKQKPNIQPVLLPDFHIYDLKLSPTKELLILYENLGENYSGQVEMKYTIDHLTPGRFYTKVVTRNNIVILKGKRQIFPTGRTIQIDDLVGVADEKSLGICAVADPNGKVVESDEDNEYCEEVIHGLSIPDYKPTALIFKVDRWDTQPRHLPIGHFNVQVKNLGSSYKGSINVQIYYKWLNEDKFLHKFPPETFEVDLGENVDIWLTLHWHYWPVRDRTTKEALSFQIRVSPGEGNPEKNLRNNILTKTLHPDGPF